MKKLKLISVVVSVLLCVNFLFAVKPNTSNSDEKLADLLIQKMEKDVILTDSQKLVLKIKLKTYITKMQNAHSMSNNVQKISYKKQASNEYQSSIDSILNPSQCQQLKQKITERENAK